MFCNELLSDGQQTVTLTAKGCKGILSASEARESDILVMPGQLVHVDCRKVYTNPKSIENSNKKRSADVSFDEKRTLRSKEKTFVYKHNCLFCGIPDVHGGKKIECRLIPVRIMDFQTSIINIDLLWKTSLLLQTPRPE